MSRRRYTPKQIIRHLRQAEVLYTQGRGFNIYIDWYIVAQKINNYNELRKLDQPIPICTRS
jgi:hypothetical protein